MTDLTVWLKTLGLEDYAEHFRVACLDWEQLPSMTDADLRELGVTALGHRKRLLAAIAALTPTRQEPMADLDDPLTPLIATLPAPLALPLRDFQQETHPVLKLWAACDTLEILLRLLVFLGTAEMAQRGPLPNKLQQRLSGCIETPSLHSWIIMAGAVAKRLAADTAFPELRSTVRNDLQPLLEGAGGAPSPETTIRGLRNRLAHGGGLSRRVAATLLDRWDARLAALWPRLSWLAEVNLIVCHATGDYRVLRGAAERPEVFSPPDPESRTTLEGAFAQGDTVLACRGEHAIPLWPLTLYGVPHLRDPEQSSDDGPVSQLYVRRGEVRLQYTPLGDTTIPLAESDETALARFLTLFQPADVNPTRSTDFTVPGFEDALRRDADRLIGRLDERDRLASALQDTPTGVLWIEGVAGVGKSYLLARIATDQEAGRLDDPQRLVLAYRFRASDERCRRETFLRFVAERLRAWRPLEDSVPGDTTVVAETQPMLEQVRQLLRLPADRHVLLILDGLDEIAARDPRFAAEVPLALAAPGVTWLCAGRPERNLPEIFTRAEASRVFPEGLPPMQAGDIRTLLLERIGPLRKQLLLQDKEQGEQIGNPFVDKVARLAEGLPLYVKYVIDDIQSGRYRVLDAGERLPPGLAGYHEELLRRCAIGTLHQVLTPLAATLATAREPLSQAALADLLYRRGRLVDAGESGARLVTQALAALASMLRRVPTPEGTDGYVLYHHSLAQQMAESPYSQAAVDTARAFLADLAAARQPTGPVAPYLYRHGIAHLLDTGRVQEALARLTDFADLMARLRTLGDPEGVTGIGADWFAVLARHPALDWDQRLWEAFWREREHILRRGNVRWPAFKILLQLAVEHADDSPVTQAAEIWLEQGHCDWVWLRNPQRAAQAVPDQCLRVLEGHTDPVIGAQVLPDGRLLSWSEDCTLRLWDGQIGAPLAILEGHATEIQDVQVLPDGRILSVPQGFSAILGTRDESPRLWDGETGALLAILEGHTGWVWDIQMLADGRLLSWSRDCSLRLWDGQTGTPLTILEGHTGEIRGVRVLADGRLLSWSRDCSLRLWDGQTGVPLAILEGHTDEIWDIQVLADGRFLSCSKDGTLRLWDGQTGAPLAILEGHTDEIWDIQVLADGRFLSCSKDGTLRLWDGQTGAPLAILEGHTDEIWDIQVLADGRFLSCSKDGTLRLWDGQTGAPLAILESHTSWIAGGVRELADGRLLSWSMEGTMRLWDGQNGALLGILEGHTGWVTGVRELADGRLLSWSMDGTLRLWDGQTGGLLSILEGHTGGIRGVQVLWNGGVLSWSNDGTLRLWDGQTSSPFAMPKRHASGVEDVQIFADRRFLSRSKDGTLRLWDGQTGAPLAILEGHTDSVGSFQMLADGRLLSKAKDGTLRLWDGQTGVPLAILAGHTGEIRGVQILWDGRLLSWSNDGTLRLWDGQTGAPLAILAGHSGEIQNVAVFWNGRFLYSSSDGTLFLWDGQTRVPLDILERNNSGAEYAPELADGFFLSWSDDGTSRLWDGQTGTSLAILEGRTFIQVICGGGFITGLKDCAGRLLDLRRWDGRTSASQPLVLEGHVDSVSNFQTLADGRLLSWSDDGTLRLWDGQTGASLAILKGHTDEIWDIQVLADGRFLSSSKDGTLRLWDGQTGASLAIQEGHSDEFWHVQVLACGHFLSRLSTRLKCYDIPRLWDGQTGALLAILEGHDTRGEVQDVRELADGRLLSYSNDSSGRLLELRLWDGQTGRSIGEPVLAKDLLSHHPDLFVQFAKIDLHASRSAGSSLGIAAVLVTQMATIPPVYWQAACAVTAHCLSTSGIFTVTLGSDHLFCLQLYRGNQRINLAEYETPNTGQDAPDTLSDTYKQD